MSEMCCLFVFFVSHIDTKTKHFQETQKRNWQQKRERETEKERERERKMQRAIRNIFYDKQNNIIHKIHERQSET